MIQQVHSVDANHNHGGSLGSSVGGQLPPKRRKIAVACNICKYRKSKCDGNRPICGACAKRPGGQRNNCVYRDSTATESVQQQLVPSTSEAGISYWHTSRTLPEYQSTLNRPSDSYARNAAGGRSQGSLRQSDQSNLPADSFTYEHSEAREAEDRNNNATSSKVLSSDELLTDQFDESAEVTNSNIDQNADAMGCVDDWALRTGLLGSSSGAGFLQQIQKVADGVESSGQDQRGMGSPHISQTLRSLGTHGKGRRQETPMTQFVLPPRKTADYLLSVYWEFSQSVFPILNKLEFDKLYVLLWTGSEEEFPDEQVFYCMLNLMFAMACKLDPKGAPKESTKSAEVFFERARSLSKFDILEISRFPLIQVSLLMAQYLQSTNMPRQCIQSIAMAVWIAQDIGLHLPSTISSLNDPHERELAKRIWQCCILFDRLAAMTFGRPLSISQDVAALASPLKLVDDEYFDPRKSIVSEKATKIEFFAEFYKLHYILGDILTALYTGPEPDPSGSLQQPKTRLFTGDLQSLFENDQKLEQWKMELPSHLQVSSYLGKPENDHIFQRQANLLHLRYLYVRLLMLRTPFTRGIHLLRVPIDDDRMPVTSQLKSVVLSRAMSLCVKTAAELVDFIYARVFDKNMQQTLPSWWYSITYIYSAATVVIAAQCFLDYLDEMAISTLTPSLCNSYKILEHYDATTPTARRCQSALELTHRKIIGPEVGKVPSRQEGTNLATRNDAAPDSEFNPFGDAPGFGAAMSNFPMFDSPDAAWLDNTMAYWDFSLWR